MHAIVCVVSDAKKGTSSTSGMMRTVETSTLLQHRIKEVVPTRMNEIIKAIKEHDFDAFAQVTMKDSNSFHAVALDTEPPIFYLNDVSRSIIALIVEYNRLAIEKTGKRKAAYTYDAGPNAVIYTEAANVKEIIQLIAQYFPQKEEFSDPFKLFASEKLSGAVPEGFNDKVASVWEAGSVKGLIHTKIGDGPRVLGAEESLLNDKGFPITLA
jgi:diphosphomevalonate decarboxylase